MPRTCGACPVGRGADPNHPCRRGAGETAASAPPSATDSDRCRNQLEMLLSIRSRARYYEYAQGRNRVPRQRKGGWPGKWSVENLNIFIWNDRVRLKITKTFQKIKYFGRKINPTSSLLRLCIVLFMFSFCFQVAKLGR